jgi:hypothetical protein
MSSWAVPFSLGFFGGQSPEIIAGITGRAKPLPQVQKGKAEEIGVASVLTSDL